MRLFVAPALPAEIYNATFWCPSPPPIHMPPIPRPCS